MWDKEEIFAGMAGKVDLRLNHRDSMKEYGFYTIGKGEPVNVECI